MGTQKTIPKEQTTTKHMQHTPEDGMSGAMAFEDRRPEAALQLKLQGLANAYTDKLPVIQQKKNTTGLPDNLKSGIENLSGHSMDDVKVHYNSDKPAQLNAHAYAQGTQIHLASGQEKHLPHEAWHVVQQKQGRVQPTTQLKEKVSINDDEGLEKEADVMGAKALQMKASPTTSVHPTKIVSNPNAPIQRVITITEPEEEGEGEISAEKAFEDITTNWEWSVDLEIDLDEEGEAGEALIQAILKSYDTGNRTFKNYNELVQAVNTDIPVFRERMADDSGEGGAEGDTVDDTEKVTAGPSSAITVVDESITEEVSLAPITLKEFKRYYGIQPKASRLIQMVGAPNLIIPEVAVLPTKGSIAYVANILTVPGRTSPQAIIDAYATSGISPENYGNFAMVIGVNMYRSLDGKSIGKITAFTDIATTAPFPCVVVPIMWDFKWGDAPYHAVMADYNRLSTEDQLTILKQEKANLDQTHIPYGSLRESITAHPATRRFVAAFSATHESVYVHLGDDDASSLDSAMRKKPLLDSYTDSIARKGGDHPPHIVVGGYSLANKSEGGDLEDSDPEAQLTVIASKIDTWFRSVLSMIVPDAIYPTEPNMAFLAAHGGTNHLETILTPIGNEKRGIPALRDRTLREEGGSIAPESRAEGREPYLSTEFLYGSSANEGGKLRDNMRERLLGKKDTTPMTHYDPSLAIATDSHRFTMKDDDRINHEKTAGRYGFRRGEALSKGGDTAYFEQIVHDILSIKQSHIGGLQKEIASIRAYRKDARKTATDVMNTVKAILLETDLPKPTSKESAAIIALTVERSGEIAAIKAKLHEVMSAMLEKTASGEGTSAATSSTGDTEGQ